MKTRYIILAIACLIAAGYFFFITLPKSHVSQQNDKTFTSNEDRLAGHTKLKESPADLRTGKAETHSVRPQVPAHSPLAIDWKSDTHNYSASSILMFDDFGLLTQEFKEYYRLSDSEIDHLNNIITGIDQEIFSIESKIKSENFNAAKREITLQIPQYIDAGGKLFDNFGAEFQRTMGPDRYSVFISNSESTIERRFAGFGKYDQKITLNLPTSSRTEVSIDATLSIPGYETPLESVTMHQTAKSLEELGASLLPYSWLTHLNIGKARLTSGRS